jgi:Na+/melibiose symporter-like transporter
VTRTAPVRPHRLALIGAAVALVIGVGLLLTPWDGPVIVLAWAVIIASVVVGAVTLFLVRAPRS